MLKYVNVVYLRMSSLWQLPGSLYGKCMTTATCVPYNGISLFRLELFLENNHWHVLSHTYCKFNMTSASYNTRFVHAYIGVKAILTHYGGTPRPSIP